MSVRRLSSLIVTAGLMISALSAANAIAVPARARFRPTSVVGLAATSTGYLQVTGRGNVYATHTMWYGSLAGRKLASPVVGIAVDAHTNGYWLVTRRWFR